MQLHYYILFFFPPQNAQPDSRHNLRPELGLSQGCVVRNLVCRNPALFVVEIGRCVMNKAGFFTGRERQLNAALILCLPLPGIPV